MSAARNEDPAQPADHAVVDNQAARQFELTADGATAFVAYEFAGQRITFTHTDVPDQFRGKGVGSALVRGALDLARERGLEVVPVCEFVAAWVRRHPAYLDLVSESDRHYLNSD